MMHNKLKETLEELCYGAKLNKFIWIAGMYEDIKLEDVLEELSTKDWQRMFPNTFSNELISSYIKDFNLTKLLLDHNKLGFLVQLYVPYADKFIFDAEDFPITWDVNTSINRSVYIYAETLEDLLPQLEAESFRIFNSYLTEFKNNTK